MLLHTLERCSQARLAIPGSARAFAEPAVRSLSLDTEGGGDVSQYLLIVAPRLARCNGTNGRCKTQFESLKVGRFEGSEAPPSFFVQLRILKELGKATADSSQLTVRKKNDDMTGGTPTARHFGWLSKQSAH